MLFNRNKNDGQPLDREALRKRVTEAQKMRPSQITIDPNLRGTGNHFSKPSGAMPPAVGRSGSMGSDSGSSLPIRGIAQALMNSNGNAFGGARVSGRNSLANMPGLQEGLARRRMQQPTMAPQQPQQPVQFTQPRVHAQGPGGVSSRWMELFRG